MRENHTEVISITEFCLAISGEPFLARTYFVLVFIFDVEVDSLAGFARDAPEADATLADTAKDGVDKFIVVI